MVHGLNRVLRGPLFEAHRGALPSSAPVTCPLLSDICARPVTALLPGARVAIGNGRERELGHGLDLPLGNGHCSESLVRSPFRVTA